MRKIRPDAVRSRLGNQFTHAWYAGQRLGLRVWDRDSLRALHLTESYSMLSQRKRLRLRRIGLQALNSSTHGAVAEIGVNRGGGLGVIADRLARDGRAVHLFDRWGDLPLATSEDGAFRGLFTPEGIERMKAEADLTSALAAAIELYTQRFAYPQQLLTVHQGWYEETLPSYAGGPLSFVHLDSDFYSSTVTAFAFLDEHLAANATVLLDDWGVWPGVEQATREHLSATRRQVRLDTFRAQAVLAYGATAT